MLSEDEVGPYWVPLSLVLRVKPNGKVEAIDVHDDVSLLATSFSAMLLFLLCKIHLWIHFL